MPIETLTYVALAARLKISPVAARRLPSGASCRAHFRIMATHWCALISLKCRIRHGN
jgi:hypothetical protein